MSDKNEWETHLATETGAECGNCGKKLTYGNDAGTGFCTECQAEKDNEKE